MKTLFASLALLISFSVSAQVDNCCINPDWIDPMAMCTMQWDPVVGCDGVTYSNSCVASVSGVTSWTNANGQTTSLDWDCGASQVLCTSWSGVEIYEPGFWTNPNDPCEMGECGPNGQFYGIAIDCAEWMGVPCDGEWVLEDGECCAECVETGVICTSYSGIDIYEVGDWTNPNNACDMGYCGEDGFFSGIIIDCGEQMGMPCDGEWVLEDGACCSTCVETPPSDCESIYITLSNGWNMIGFACAENTDALEAFSPIQDKIIIAKDGIGNAYLPDWDFNGIGDLERGFGYLIKVTEQIEDYNICAE